MNCIKGYKITFENPSRQLYFEMRATKDPRKLRKIKVDVDESINGEAIVRTQRVRNQLLSS